MPQIKSKKRVADHGEVFTRQEEVNAMLDLVSDRTLNRIGIEKTFLEPACGTGNFLLEILERKLTQVQEEKFRKSRPETQKDYEFYAIVAISSLYGIELLKDNVKACRENLLSLFRQKYTALFPKSYQEECVAVAEFLLEQNILHGDALAMVYCDENNQPIRSQPLHFSQWAAVDFPRKWCLKRQEFVYQDLIFQDGKADPYLFEADYFPCYFLEIQNATKIDYSI